MSGSVDFDSSLSGLSDAQSWMMGRAEFPADQIALAQRTNSLSPSIHASMADLDADEPLPLDNEVVDINAPAPLSEERIDELASNVNFVARIRMLVFQLLEQTSRISENDRKQLETMKREYRISSNDAAGLTRKIGNAAPWISGVAFVVSLSQFMWTNPDDRGMIKFLADQIPNAGSMFTSRHSARQAELQAISSLRLQEIQIKGSKTGSENFVQELKQFYTSLLQEFAKASSSN